MVEALLVVDEERGGLLGLEGGQGDVLAPLALQRDPAPNDLTDGQPRADFVEQLRGKAHAGSMVRGNLSH